MSGTCFQCRFCAREDPKIVRNDIKTYLEEVKSVAQFEVSKTKMLFQYFCTAGKVLQFFEHCRYYLSAKTFCNLSIVFQVYLTPTLPDKICDICTQRLKDAHYFRLLCRQSEETYLKRLNKPFTGLSEGDIDYSVVVKVEEVKGEADDVNLDEFEENATVEYLDEARSEMDLDVNDFDIAQVESLPPEDVKVEEEPEPLPKMPKKKTQKSTVIKRRETSRICCQCDYLSYTMKDLQRHYNNAHPHVVNGTKSDDVVQCPLCFEQFASEEELTQTHLKSKYDMVCKWCDITFEHKMKWRKHLETHPVHRYVCHECGQSFGLFTSYNSHLFNKHRNANKFLCTFCGKQFGRRLELKVHMACHQEKAYQCDICGTKVARRGTLLNHMRIHTGEKRFVCEYCGRAFTDLTDKKRHVSSHTGIYPYNCEVCNRGFHRLKFYQDHKNKMH